MKPIVESAFREYGLPKAIRTDYGPPFASTAAGGLSRLAVWWIRLGISPERIEKGKSQQNGRHERMHRTLKADTAGPPAQSRRAQQRAFEQFRKEYNEEPPHEALGQRPPVAVFEHSQRPYPSRLPLIDYPEHFLVRNVDPGSGCIKFKNTRFFVSESLFGEQIGLEEVKDGLWQIFYGPFTLGVYDEHTRDRGLQRARK